MPMETEDPVESPLNENLEIAGSRNMTVSSELDNIIRSLVANDTITFKSQQRGDPEPTEEEKTEIARKSFDNSKVDFLLKFGKYLNYSQLEYFEQFTQNSEPNWDETKIILDELKKSAASHYNKDIKRISIHVKNRRYQALLQMIEDDEYFSELEMMKRSPLLYEQLVGQYLTEEEKRERDKYDIKEGVTFVKILLEGIERDDAEASRKLQQQKEDSQMEESDSSEEEDDISSECPKVVTRPEKPSSSRWGEFEEQHMTVTKSKKAAPSVTAEERRLLKEEFVTTMYENFLEGKDDFDYDTVDRDSKYDSIAEIDQDEEEKYFDSEEPEVVTMEEDVSSEDELDIYMGALNQHPAVSELAMNINDRL